MLGFLTRFGLRFPDATDERRFVDHYVRGQIGWTQVAMLLGAFTYAGYTVWDWVLYPEIVPTTLAIRGGVALFVLLPLTALLSTPAQKWAEPLYLLYCVIPGCVLPFVYLVIPSGFTHAAPGMIMVILFVSTMLPLRIGSLAVFCVMTWIALAIAELVAPPMPAGLRFINHFLVGNAYALSLFAVGVREYRARRQFTTALALRREKERSEASLRELRSTQGQLVQAEKLASLGQLVAGVAHEVSTPLGVALTTSTTIESDLKRLTEMLQSGAVRRSELNQTIAHLGQGTRLLFGNLHRATELVDSFKQVATDQANEARSSFELGHWVRDIMMTLRPLLSRQGHDIRVTCDDGIVIDTYPGALAQVIRNLAFNAATHGFPDGRKGVLDLTLMRSGSGGVRIVVADDGCGIAPEHLPRVFDPFFTTRRDKGSTGLGLHIVFNLVVSTLRGTIEIDSEPGKGTRCIVDLPLSLDMSGRRDAIAAE